ncbi:NACHT, LRR and PYD domains-containing protein 12-like, partial [Gastrophryne carolinensis]
IQKKHKDRLLMDTQNLVENKPPGASIGQQCFSICERYVNLTVISNNCFTQPSQDELTQTGEQLEGCLQRQKGCLQNILPGRLFHWCHKIKCEPRLVMVSGFPGVGKTTLMQKFAYDWAGGKHYERFSFVFFFKFRELNELKETTLEKLILRQYDYLDGQLEGILQEPEKLLFLFDGLDECAHPIDFQSSTFCTNAKQPQQIGVIVVSLVNQTLLEGCSVLMTSRPSKLLLIGAGAKVFQRMVRIMGFSSKEIQVYFKNYFGDQELTEKALNYVKKNDTLYTFCYSPAYCWIICTVLSMCFKAQPTNNTSLMAPLPKTVTQLFVIFIANILTNHNQDQERAPELLMCLGQMAEYGVSNHILVFDERFLESYNVDTSSHLLSSFMIAFNQSSQVTFSFIHAIIQAFLAALHFYLPSSTKSLDASLQKAKSHEGCSGEIFLRFVCGLSDLTTRAILKPHLGELSNEASRNVITWLESILKELDGYHMDKRRLLNLFYCLFETRNKDLVSQALSNFKSFDFFRVYLTPLNCAVLSYVLNCREETEKLHLNECSIRSEGLERLKPALHTIGDISLSSNSLKDSGMESIESALTHPQCKIKKL